MEREVDQDHTADFARYSLVAFELAVLVASGELEPYSARYLDLGKQVHSYHIDD